MPTVAKPMLIKKMQKARETYRFDHDTWRRAAIVFAEMYRDFAPDDVRRALVCNRLSLIPEETIFLAELFLLVLFEAEARTGDLAAVDVKKAWQTALMLGGVKSLIFMTASRAIYPMAQSSALMKIPLYVNFLTYRLMRALRGSWPRSGAIV